MKNKEFHFEFFTRWLNFYFITLELLIGSSKIKISASNYWLWLFICCKTKLKIIFFFWKNICFFTKYTLFAEKNVFIWKKSFIEKFFYWKNLFYREKYKWKCKKYTSHLKNIFMLKMFVLQRKYKSFLNVYSFCKDIFLIIKNMFDKTSLWTQ